MPQKYSHLIWTVEETTDALKALHEREKDHQYFDEGEPVTMLELIEVLLNYFDSEAGKNERANMDVADFPKFLARAAGKV